jgi:hypothetical protein
MATIDFAATASSFRPLRRVRVMNAIHRQLTRYDAMPAAKFAPHQARYDCLCSFEDALYEVHEEMRQASMDAIESFGRR